MREAIAAFDRALALEDTVEWRFDKGLAVVRAADLATAEREFTLVLERDPRHLEAKFELAMVLRDRGEFARARVLFEHLTVEQPNRAAAWFELGLLDLHAADEGVEAARRSARHALERTIGLAPQHAGALLQLGRLLIAMGETGAGDAMLVRYRAALRVEEAIENRRAYLVQYPGDAGARRELVSLLLGSDQPAAARVEAERWTRAAPGDAAAWASLAEAWQRLARHDLAEAAAQRARRLRPLPE